MWAYRLNHAPHFGVLFTAEVMKKKLNAKWEAQANDAPTQFDFDLRQARGMARALGWDGILAEPIRCFALPGPDSFVIGFVIVQASSGQRFVVSPAPLEFLKDRIDWDAHTSTEEVLQITRDITGRAPMNRTTKIENWRRSSKGNMWTTINGARVTIVAEMNGYKALVNSGDGARKTATQLFQTEIDCKVYVENNFYEVISVWGVPNEEENPFEGVDFSAGETDAEEDDDIPF